MTGAGAPGAPGIIKCLLQDKRIQLLIADADPDSVGRYLHQPFIKIPAANDPEFIQTLLQICEQHQIHCLMPLVTKELFPLAQSVAAFEQVGTKLLLSSQESIVVANNKAACYKLLSENRIAMPAFHICRTVSDIEAAASALGFPANDFCFKPSQSNGSRGFRIVSDAINQSDLLFAQKPNQTYLTYSQAIELLAAQPFPELLVSEYLPGEEYSVDCIADQGTMKLAVPRLRIRMNNGISVHGAFCKDEPIIEYCRKIISILKLHGNIGIQVKRNSSGEALLLEVNPRVQGTIVAGLGAGVNLPLLAVYQELGMSIESDLLNIRWGTKFFRYWTEVFY